MTVLVTPIYNVLVGDATLTAYLSTYNGVPAVFSNMKVPPDADTPFIAISPPTADGNFDTLKEFGRDTSHSIWIIFPETGSVSNLDAAAERVRTLLHKTSLTVPGFQHVQSFTTGPVSAPLEGGRGGSQQDEVDEVGRLVTVRALLRQL
jgi:hypothetical protein